MTTLELSYRPRFEVVIEQCFKRATGGPGVCERRQSGLNVLSDRLPGLVVGLIKCQMFDRT